MWLDGALHFCTGAAEQKSVNLTANPHVVLTTGCNSWDEGLDVVVEGDAVRVTDDSLLRRLAAAWTTKWDGRWQFEVRGACFHAEGGEALVYAVQPSKVLAFAKGTLRHTRHSSDQPRPALQGPLEDEHVVARAVVVGDRSGDREAQRAVKVGGARCSPAR